MAKQQPVYNEYKKVEFISVTDGDTCLLIIEIDQTLSGFNITTIIRIPITIRLLEVNTPEVFNIKKDSEEYKKGKMASAFTANWFKDKTDLTVKLLTRKGLNKKDKYGRYLGFIYSSEECLNELLKNQEW